MSEAIASNKIIDRELLEQFKMKSYMDEEERNLVKKILETETNNKNSGIADIDLLDKTKNIAPPRSAIGMMEQSFHSAQQEMAVKIL